MRTRHWLFLLTAGVACRSAAPGGVRESDEIAAQGPLISTGVSLDPEGRTVPVGQFPLAMIRAPGGRQVVLLLNGYSDQGIQVLDAASGQVLQTELQPAAFLGLAFAPDGQTLYASGGNEDVVFRYAWRDGRATLQDRLVLAVKVPNRSGTRYPGGLAPSPDGRFLYVSENLADSLAVIDLASGQVVQRVPAGRYPYGVAVAPDSTVYVSAWGGDAVRAYRPAGDGRLALARTIPVARHPSAMLLNADGSRLFVTSGSTDRVSVVDTRRGRLITDLLDPAPAGPSEGSTPNALALSTDGTRLFVAEADNNAVAVFDLSAGSSGLPAAAGDDRLAGRIPTEAYPTALLASGDTLLVISGKGRGSKPNRDTGPRPDVPNRRPAGYTLRAITSTMMISTVARADAATLAQLGARVARANNWDRVRTAPSYPPFEHVIYIIKENRTYDQVLGDLPQGDGDTALVYFPRPVSPNHHALAERFGLFDRFFVNAEVSPDGHNWSMAAYTTDYLQKTVPSNYGGRGRTYDWEGTNRGKRPAVDEDVAEPASGYLWNLVQQKGLTFRNFGEFVMPDGEDWNGPAPSGYRGLKPFLEAHTDSAFPGFNLDIPDQRRADIWIGALEGWVARGEMPAMQIVRLPNDHTTGAAAGKISPRAYMADNDLALGRMIEALSKSPFWQSTAVFVLEDDAQNGPDHVDSHRSVLLVISAWNRGGVIHRWVNTTDVIATMEEILGLGQLSQFDYFGRPLRQVWADRPDLRPYEALMPQQSLTERNPEGGPGAAEAAGLDFTFEDVAEEDDFNLSLWLAIKGPGTPYPGTMRLNGLELRRGAAVLGPEARR